MVSNSKSVIDVGALHWRLDTNVCRRVFPAASILMIEPQAATQRTLKQITAEDQSIDVAHVLLGRRHDSQIPSSTRLNQAALFSLNGSEKASRPRPRLI